MYIGYIVVLSLACPADRFPLLVQMWQRHVSACICVLIRCRTYFPFYIAYFAMHALFETNSYSNDIIASK